MNAKLISSLALGSILALSAQAKSLLFSLAVDPEVTQAAAPSRDLFATLKVFRTGAGVLKIQLAATNVPNGLTVSFSKNPVVFTANSPGTLTSTLNVAVAANVPNGTYSCDILARDLVHGATGSVTFTFTVRNGVVHAAPVQLSIFLVPAQDQAIPLVKWASVPGQLFMLQATPSLSEPIVWSNLGAVIADAEGNCDYRDYESALYPIRFYRALAQ